MKIKSYKGFESDLTCRGFKYKIGKKYKQGDKIVCCQKGFHACTFPLSTLYYYHPSDSRYCEVEQSGKIVYGEDKVASSEIYIKKEIGLKGIIEANIKTIYDNCTDKCSTSTERSVSTNTDRKSVATTTGEFSVAANTGKYSLSKCFDSFSISVNTGNNSTSVSAGCSSITSNIGDCSAAMSTGFNSAAVCTGCYSVALSEAAQSAAVSMGYTSAALSTGKYSVALSNSSFSTAAVKERDSIAIAAGYQSKAKGALGDWLVLTERDSDWNIRDVKAVRVDGVTIEEDTFYELINGEIVK